MLGGLFPHAAPDTPTSRGWRAASVLVEQAEMQSCSQSLRAGRVSRKTSRRLPSFQWGHVEAACPSFRETRPPARIELSGSEKALDEASCVRSCRPQQSYSLVVYISRNPPSCARKYSQSSDGDSSPPGRLRVRCEAERAGVQTGLFAYRTVCLETTPKSRGYGTPPLTGVLGEIAIREDVCEDKA